MKYRRERGRPVYHLMKKRNLVRKGWNAEPGRASSWGRSNTRAGLSLLDLELFAVEVQRSVGWADDTASSDESEDDELENEDKPQFRNRNRHRRRPMGELELRWRER